MAAPSTAQSIHKNNLCGLFAQDRLCTTSLKMTTDTLFIDLEHTTLSLRDAGQLCIAGLNAGVTPFVRVPYQCGRGMVQRVLDMGSMGVIFPHVSSVAEAREAVRMCRFRPLGERSLSQGLPHFGLRLLEPAVVMRELNATGSTVFVMIETRAALESVEGIAGVDGMDAVLVGSNGLGPGVGLFGRVGWGGVLGALKRVGEACRREGKVFAIAGLYHRPDLMERVVNEFGARWVLGGLDAGLLIAATRQNCEVLRGLQKA